MKRLTDKQIIHRQIGKTNVSLAALDAWHIWHRSNEMWNEKKVGGHIFKALPFTESPEETLRRELDLLYNARPIIIKRAFPSDYTII